jgi:hypothetical protein
LGVVYQITSDGRRRRALINQAAQLHQAFEYRDAAESEANEPLDPEIAAALEDDRLPVPF